MVGGLKWFGGVVGIGIADLMRRRFERNEMKMDRWVRSVTPVYDC